MELLKRFILTGDGGIKFGSDAKTVGRLAQSNTRGQCVAVFSCGRVKVNKSHLTCPHSKEPKPKKVHQSHWSMDSPTQLNGFPPNCTMTIYKNTEAEFSFKQLKLERP